MKKVLTGLAVAVLLASSMVFANVPTNKQHKKLKGKDGATVNCTYCHKKAAIPKKKGNDVAKLKKGEYCAGKGCHE